MSPIIQVMTLGGIFLVLLGITLSPLAARHQNCVPELEYPEQDDEDAEWMEGTPRVVNR